MPDEFEQFWNAAKTGQPIPETAAVPAPNSKEWTGGAGVFGKPSAGEAMTRAFATGGAEVAGAVGQGIERAGRALGLNQTQQVGEAIAKRFEEVRQNAALSGPDAETDWWKHPSLLVSPRWLGIQVARTVPTFAAQMAGALTGEATLNLLGKSIAYGPSVIAKLARIGELATKPGVGGAVGGGAVAGALQNATTYQEVIDRGGTPEDAAKASYIMGMAAAGYNAIAFGGAFMPRTIGGKIAGGASTGALAAWLTAPTDAVVVGRDLREALHQGFLASPAGAFFGMVAGATAGATGERAPTGTVRGGPDLSQTPETAVPPAAEGGKPGAASSAAPNPATAALVPAGEGQVAKIPGPEPTGGQRPNVPPPTPEELARAAQGRPSDYEVHVNTKHLDPAGILDGVMADLDHMRAETMAEDRARVSFGEAKAKAAKLVPSLDDALNLKVDPDQPYRELGLRTWYKHAADQTVEMARRMEDPADTEASGSFFGWLSTAHQLGKLDEYSGSVSGRGQVFRKIDVEDPPQVGRAPIVDAIRRMQEGADPHEVAAAMRKLQKAQVPTFMRQFSDGVGRFGQAWQNAYIAALLTGPATILEVNPLSNGLMVFQALSETRLAEGNPGVPRGSSGAMERALTRSVQDAFRVAGHAMSEGTDPTGISKFEVRLPFTGEGLGIAAENPLRLVVDRLGHVAAAGPRALMATDAFFKVIALRMSFARDAFQMATDEGLTGKALSERTSYLESNPTMTMWENGARFALDQTAQLPLSPRMQRIQGGIRSVYAIGPLIGPFMRVTTNVMGRAVQRTPMLQLANAGLRRELFEGTPREQSLARAKLEVGAMTGAAVVALVGSGHITGGWPENPQAKEALKGIGWQPYSLRVGDTYYSYSRLDPLGMNIGLISDFAQIAAQIPDAHRDELARALALALSRNLTNMNYIQGAAQMFEAIRSGGKDKRMVESMARSMVPGIVRTVRKQDDPYIREIQTALDAYKDGVPGWSKELPMSHDVFYQPIMYPPGLGPDWMSAIASSQRRNDPVWEEIGKVGVTIGMPPKVIYGGDPQDLQMNPPKASDGIELTGKEWDDFVRLAGRDVRDAAGHNLKEALADMFANNELYRREQYGPDGGRALLITSTVNAFRDQAKRQLLRDTPELTSLFQLKTIARAEMLRPVPRGELPKPSRFYPGVMTP